MSEENYHNGFNIDFYGEDVDSLSYRKSKFKSEDLSSEAYEYQIAERRFREVERAVAELEDNDEN